MIKICPYSGEIFTPKRRNQVFASAKNRRAYHNENASALRRIQSPINRSLEKNLLLITSLVKKGETKIFNREELLLKGYNTNFFTHIINYKGSNCRCLYHFVFPKTENVNYITITYPKND
jgi:hypothetical protein